MISAILTVTLIGVMLFAFRRMLKERDEAIAIKSSIVTLLGTIIITFGNSVVFGGTAKVEEMLQINLISSAFISIVIWFLFFWKKDDLFYYLDKSGLLEKSHKFKALEPEDLIIDDKVEYQNEEFEEWQKQQKVNQEARKQELKARLQRDYDLAKEIEFNPVSFDFHNKESDDDTAVSIVHAAKKNKLDLKPDEKESK